MFIIEEGNCILVHDKTGRLVYKSMDIVQFKKFNEESLVIITKESVDFVSEVKDESRYDITVVSDTKFVSATIHDNLIFIQRKTIIPLMDIYDSNFMNLLRLYQNIKGQWIYFIFTLGLPLRTMVPTYLNGKFLYGERKAKPCVIDLESRQLKSAKLPKNKGIPLQEQINKFTVGVVK